MEYYRDASHSSRTKRQSVGVQSSRRCTFEQMEPRVMLAADVALGPPDLSTGFTGGQTGSISGSVLEAYTSSNCETHEAAVGMPEVRVQLLDETGTVVEETTTDAEGAYHFADLIPGQYSVRRVTSSTAVEGAAHVGAGGGVSLGTNHVGGIGVQGGAQLTDYDFCQFEASTETSSFSTAESASLASILAFAYQTQPNVVPSVNANTPVEFNPSANQVPQSPLETTRPADFYGGSSRPLNPPKSIRAWDDFPAEGLPIDDLFSTIGFLQLSASDRPGVATLDSIYGDANEGDETFADGYTSESLEWCNCEDQLELQEVLGSEPGIDLDSEVVALETTDAPQVASRQRVPAAH